MSIEIGSKYVKDGEVVEVLNICSVNYEDNFIKTIFYATKECLEKGGFIHIENLHIISICDFLKQYKPVTFEYMYAFKDAHNICRLPTSNFYKDDEEFELYHPNKTEYQRLDFTKRERKC